MAPEAVTEREASSLYSSLRERIVEHLFLGEVLRTLWRAKAFTTEVSRAESDAFGYDIAIEFDNIIRHVQLKANKRRPKTISVKKSLAQKPSGCVVWIQLDEKLNLGPDLWFGGRPGARLPSLNDYPASKKIRPDKKLERLYRQNHVDVPSSEFDDISDISQLVHRLFDATVGKTTNS
jgi:hypothetical protein